MTLQQLKYADAVATCGSISEAARRVFVTQPTLTESIRALEEELRTAIFTRSTRGIAVTREGEEFLASARQILDDAARIQEKYTGKAVRKPQFAVSCQHYAFAVEAFMEVVKECDSAAYDFTLRETVTSEIIDDVARHRSEIGVMYLSTRNERVISKLLKNEGLKFEELFVSHPHVFLGKRHPLAKRKGGVAPAELDDYPFISFEQGTENALYFAEEVMPSIHHDQPHPRAQRLYRRLRRAVEGAQRPRSRRRAAQDGRDNPRRARDAWRRALVRSRQDLRRRHPQPLRRAQLR